MAPRLSSIAALPTPAIARRIHDTVVDDGEEEPTVRTDVPRLLAESIYSDDDDPMLDLSRSGVVPSSAALERLFAESVQHGIDESIAPAPVPCGPAVQSPPPAMELVVGDAPATSAEAPKARVETVRAPLRGRLVRAVGAAVFAFVAMSLLVITAVQARTYRQLAARILASRPHVSKIVEATRELQSKLVVRAPPPPKRAVAPRAIHRPPQHHSKKRGGIIRDVPF